MDTLIPLYCPACKEPVRVTHLSCNQCDTRIEGNYVLPSIAYLNKKDQQLLIDFLLCNGKPTYLAKKWNMSYPAMRTRLDALIKRFEERNEEV